MPIDLSVGQYNLVYNFLSFTIAVMGAATVFFWFGRNQVAPAYKTAMTITGLVTFIAFYHYFRIAESWEAAYTIADDRVTVALNPQLHKDLLAMIDDFLAGNRIPLTAFRRNIVFQLRVDKAGARGTALDLDFPHASGRCHVAGSLRPQLPQ